MSFIDKITLRNFKAFNEVTEIDFKGNHLLMYGENGSGKSSIYWALYTMLQSANKNETDIAKYFTPNNPENLINYSYLSNLPSFTIDAKGNIDNPQSIGLNAYVEVLFTTKEKLTINSQGLTCFIWDDEDERYVEDNDYGKTLLDNLNRSSDFISHRLLINFYNFRNSKQINLWEVFVRDVLPFLQTNLGAGANSLGNIIKDIETNKPFYNYAGNSFKLRRSNHWSRIQYVSKITNFNLELDNWLNEIDPLVNDFYNNYFREVHDENIEITLDYDVKLSFGDIKQKSRNGNNDFYLHSKYHVDLNNPSIKLIIKTIDANGNKILVARPQSYFNEAKLTQIALSVRFALTQQRMGLLEGQFLALDDLLVSLDMSNRDKVLEIILNVFAPNYKIYLLTHERSFFNMAKARIESEHNKNEWSLKELYGIDEDHNNPQINNSDDFLTKSIFQYKQKDYPASVNYLRKELEKVLNDNLPGKVKKGDNGEDKSTLDSIITSAITYLEKLDINPLPLKKCQQYLQILLNPLSHNEEDVDAYETDIKRIRKVIEELKPFLIDIKKRTKEVFPRLRKISLTITENDTVTQQKYTLELQEELYSITEANGDIRLSECKINSTESRTFTSGNLQEKADGNYKNERWKSNSLESLFNSICEYKQIEIVPNYIDFYETLEEVKVNTLI